MPDAEKVRALCKKSMYQPDEIAKPSSEQPKDAVFVEGICYNYAFHPQRLEESRKEIEEQLMSLPPTFFLSKGGGWSFLQACMDKDEKQWTGEHFVMEQLFCLGIAIGKAKWCLPKSMWSALPGGMPYVTVIDK